VVYWRASCPGRYDPNSSSSALASFRSRVSNPSVNHTGKPGLSVDPAQTFFYFLSNRVGGPIRCGCRVRRDCIRGDRASRL